MGSVVVTKLHVVAAPRERTLSGITSEVGRLIDRALAEDLDAGDATTEALIPKRLQGQAAIVARSEGVLAGGEICAAVFRRVDPEVAVEVRLKDGSALEGGSVIAEVEGPVASILMAERTALNFLQHLSGIATKTRRYVDAVEGYSVRILDTRKTTPGLRTLEKQAVRAGGGYNHRRNLSDGILIKDNHIHALQGQGLGLSEVVEQARAGASHMLRVEVEVERVDQAKEALDGGAEVLLLDNMSLEEMAQVVELARGRAITEASGGLTLEKVRGVAATGVDLISSGALTHSVDALDIGMDLI